MKTKLNALFSKSMASCGILLLLCCSIFVLPVRAQQPSYPPFPVDTKVRYGTLDNGLTYYIRHNGLPKQQADFYIAQRVGSVLEEDNQAGLAHFLEHMAFNGSENFPERMMIEYLETIGVKFGANLNAYTAFDETVYNISSVPVVRQGIIDSCLLILHDWSGFLSLTEKSMLKERGVIREEMRTRNSANFRQIEKLLPQIMAGSKYANRMPIGTEEVIMNFGLQELVDYYHKWYRPDLQGIIVVGDIDVDEIESKIKTIFADVPKPENAAERTYFTVPDNDAPIVGIVTDPEATDSGVSIFYKRDRISKEERGTLQGMVVNYFNNAAAMMLNARLAEIAQKADAPFSGASCGNSDFIVSKTKEMWAFGADVKNNDVGSALKAITVEAERAKRYGFTEPEFDRARTNILKLYENAYNEREKQYNGSYTREYVEHFTDGGYIPGIEVECQTINAIAPQIPLEAINQYFASLIGENNIVIVLTAPEKEGLEVPSETMILKWFDEARSSGIEGYKEDFVNEPLMKKMPKSGKIKSEKRDPRFGTTNITLSNGVKVVLKPTDFKDNEIVLSAFSPGGSSLFPNDNPVNIKTYGTVSGLGGIAGRTPIEMGKLLAGKSVSVRPTISVKSQGISASCIPQDIETMFQLIYLTFTEPRMDQELFDSYVARAKSQLENQDAQPATALSDTMTTLLYRDVARFSRIKTGDIDRIDYQTIMDWRMDRYKDAGNFTFVLVGNIDEQTIRPLLERYLGSLPSSGRKESPKSVDLGFNPGMKTSHFDKEMQNPTTTVVNIYTGQLENTLEQRLHFNMLKQILDIVYTEKVREDESGTYGVEVGGNIAFYPQGQAVLQIAFDTNAEKRDVLKKIVRRELDNIAAEGPRQEDFNKVKEYIQKNIKDAFRQNGYWLSTLMGYYENNYDGYTDYERTLNTVTVDDIRDVAKALLDQGNFIEVIMTGVPVKEK